MAKIVLKCALKTLLALAVLFVLVFGVLSLGFPQVVAGWCEKTGNYTLAVRYSALKYSYTKSVNDLARTYDEAMLSGKDKLIVKYGDKFVFHTDYDDYCLNRDNNEEYGGYKFLTARTLAKSKYNRGDLPSAIQTASKVCRGMTGFPVGNPLGSLAIVVATDDGAVPEQKQAVLAALEEYADAPIGEEQITYFNMIKSSLES